MIIENFAAATLQAERDAVTEKNTKLREALHIAVLELGNYPTPSARNAIERIEKLTEPAR